MKGQETVAQLAARYEVHPGQMQARPDPSVEESSSRGRRWRLRQKFHQGSPLRRHSRHDEGRGLPDDSTHAPDLAGRSYNYADPGRAVTEYNWKLDEYIRTTVSRYTQDTERVSFASQDGLTMPDGFHKHYITPEIKWEFAHPKLPMIRVTAQNSKVLPLTLPGLKDPEPTEYSVSFVISFQNRWESLDNLNRWVKRFKETPWGNGRSDDDQEKYQEIPGEWHYTDYIQHSIIGPVVLQIHESPVLEPGTYSVVPNATHWETPGYIATDNQMLKPRRVPNDQGIINRDSEFVPHFDDLQSSDSPNANIPLPGHVITDADTGPGSEIW